MVESSSETKKHFKITFQSKRYDKKEDIEQDLPGHFDHENVEEITLSGNSYGKEACEAIGMIIGAKECPKLTTVNFNDLFVSRLIAELPSSLEALVRSIIQNKIVHLNLSDNAFGPRGIPAFDFLFKAMPSLKTLKISNCGLGAEGGEMIAASLAENKEVRLAHFSAGRDRLENKGITAISSVLGGHMAGSLEVIEVPQNGIKKDGMMALLEALKANA